MMASRKQSVEWHKECLANHRRWIDELHRERKRLNETIQRFEERYDYRQAQIERAEAEGITEFDAERFKPKKGKAN